MVNDTNFYKDRFGDIWFRARHNALANLEAAKHYKRLLLLIDVLVSLLIILPFLVTTLPHQFWGSSDYGVVLSASSSIGALYFSLVSFVREWRVNLDNHIRAHAIFNNIAQKSRRGGNTLQPEEQQYLLRSLEEMFETAKFNFSEPSDKHYDLGLKRILNMPKWPFGLLKEDFVVPSNVTEKLGNYLFAKLRLK